MKRSQLESETYYENFIISPKMVQPDKTSHIISINSKISTQKYISHHTLGESNEKQPVNKNKFLGLYL